MAKRYGWARLTEEESDAITNAKREFREEVLRHAPFKQMWQAAEWIVGWLDKWIRNP